MIVDSRYIEGRIQKYVAQDGLLIKQLNNVNSINLLSGSRFDIIIVNDHLHNLRFLNKFHENINSKLTDNGLYIFFTEVIEQRNKVILDKTHFKFGYIIIFLDFIFNRILPKLKFTQKLYYWATQGKIKRVSIAETLGRVVSCGFSIVEYNETENDFFVIARKTSSPCCDNNPSYSVIFKMKRIGLGGKEIGIYKFRTMHPFSEYLQEYMYKNSMLNSNGDKIDSDFRITAWGKFLRKYWLDELPQLINIFRGDISLVGVRAISKVKLNLYSQELQDLRKKVKPGLIPPFYADMPNSFEAMQSSEKKYIIKKINSPLITDIVYFFKAFVNIVFKGARSK
jgi:lipopolysaccharide/colanic/teichoic acid biosynthesis glycosyltransferase